MYTYVYIYNFRLLYGKKCLLVLFTFPFLSLMKMVTDSSRAAGRKTDKVDKLDAQLVIDIEYNPKKSLKEICKNRPDIYGTKYSKLTRTVQNKYNQLRLTKSTNFPLYCKIYNNARVLIPTATEEQLCNKPENSDLDSDSSDKGFEVVVPVKKQAKRVCKKSLLQ